ncbi:MAG: aspartate--tRNA(Asn) ligase [Lachnospiraceae bacterium]|nr:aspartate--tRNA(Asn) ligase [Lachnospiraceae bacterium]
MNKETINREIVNRKTMMNESTMTTEELAKYIGEIVHIHGSIYKIRKMKGFSFVLLRTGREVVQCVAEQGIELPLEESCVEMEAEVVSEERSKLGFELHIQAIRVLSSPAAPSPIVINQKLVEASLENQLDFRPITLRNQKQRAIFKLQEGICRGFREFLYNHSFTEIHTPKLVKEGAEGGANIFGLNYFGQQAYLAQSPQFYKQMMVGVFERVFEIGPVFRAEKHDTSRHLNEYTSVDFEMGYIQSFEEIMKMEEEMLKYTFTFLQEHYRQELEILQIALPVIQSIPSISFREAKRKISKAYNRPIKDWEDFEPEEERLLYELFVKETGSEFVFVTHYPSAKRPFYAMDSEGNGGNGTSEAGQVEKLGSVTESFDLLFRGLEITTGGQRIHEYGKQLAKMKARNMNPEQFESYLMMHKHGMPPHGGLGLGLERFTCKLLGYENVRYTTLFPRDINRLVP